MTKNEYDELIKEGLIRTWNIYKYENNLRMELFNIGLNFDLNIIDKFTYEILLYDINWLNDENVLKEFFAININTLGYYPSFFFTILKNGMQKSFKYDRKIFNDNLKIANIDKMKIIFNSKYEDGYYTNDLIVPDKLYHVSPTINRNKILTNGLYPKTNMRKENHPERIYFAYNYDDCDKLIDNFKINDIINNKINTKYDLYEINSKELNIIIHTDPNFFDKGCYTYDNINPNKIKLIKLDI
jgi:hypothetical protein